MWVDWELSVDYLKFFCGRKFEAKFVKIYKIVFYWSGKRHRGTLMAK